MSLDCSTIALVEQYITQYLLASGSAPYMFTRQTANLNTYLDNGNIPSNKTGVPFGLNNGKLGKLWVGNELLTPFDFSIYWHLGDEISLTLLATVTFTGAARTQLFDASDFGIVAVPKDVQLAGRITAVAATRPKNIKVYPIVTGNN